MSEKSQEASSGQPEDLLYTYDSFGTRNKNPSNQNFLWWCAGAHQKLLKNLPSEHTKYSGLGGVLLATFLLAALSSGYAIYSVFGNWFWTILIAMAWGMILFNFDRFLVSTMRKYGVSRNKLIWMAVPRMLLALLIGITIARPLELKLFEKEMAVKMAENLHKKIQRNDSLLLITNRFFMQSAIDERALYTTRKTVIEDSLRHLQAAYLQEADGTGGSGQRGIERLTRLKLDAFTQALDRYDPELAELNRSILIQDSILNGARAALEGKRRVYEASTRLSIGFLERNKALSDLAEEEPSVWWTSLMLTLLIILIEVGPILSKLIMPVGPYDMALAREELMQMAADENEMRKSRESVFEKKKMFYRKQKEMSDQLVDKLTRLQQKHIDQELDKWDRGEWNAKDYRASMDEVMRKIKEQYQFKDEHLI